MPDSLYAVFTDIRLTVGSRYETINHMPWILCPVYRAAVTDRALKIERLLWSLLDAIDWALPVDWPPYAWRRSQANHAPVFIRNVLRQRLSLPPLPETSLKLRRGWHLPPLSTDEFELICDDLDELLTALGDAKVKLASRPALERRATKVIRLQRRVTKVISTTLRFRTNLLERSVPKTPERSLKG